MYCKVPIVGDGKTRQTSFRPDLPEWVSWKALMPTDEAGRLTFADTIVDVDDDVAANLLAYADSQAALIGRPILTVLTPQEAFTEAVRRGGVRFPGLK